MRVLFRILGQRSQEHSADSQLRCCSLIRTELSNKVRKALLRKFPCLVLATAVAVISRGLPADDVAPDSWSSFQNGGQCQLPTELAISWSAEQDTIAWQAEIEGYGQSTPVILDEQVLVTSTSGDNKEKYHLASFDLKSGERVWQQNFDNPTPEKNSTYVSRAAPTPVVDADGVYAFFEGGLLIALTKQGETRWTRNLVDEYGPVKARHGLASSLEQDASNLYVWVERSEDPYLMAVSKRDGSNVWKVAGLGATTWSTPRLVDVDSSQQLVCSASGIIAGFDPSTGERLWTFDGIANNSSCTPIPVAKGRFLIGASDGRGEENAGKGAESNGVIEIEQGTDGTWSADYVWQARKATSSFGSPIVAGDSALFVNRVGVLFRLDLATGEALSTTRVQCGGIWATPIVANDKIYLFGQKGVTSVVDLSSGEEISANSLWARAEEPADGEQSDRSGSMSFGGAVLYAAAPAPPYWVLRRGDRLYGIGPGSN